MQVRSKEFKIANIGVKEGVDLGSKIKDSLLPNLVLYGGMFFYCSMLCKWTTSFVESTWVICQQKTKFTANIGCVMSLKWSRVR